jgi:hypothetical protein
MTVFYLAGTAKYLNILMKISKMYFILNEKFLNKLFFILKYGNKIVTTLNLKVSCKNCDMSIINYI